MGLFENIGRTISDVGQTTIQKGRDMADIAKFTALISENEKKLKNVYAELGEAYTMKYGDDSENEFAEIVKKAKEYKEETERLRDVLNTIKKVRKCPKCGAEVVEDIMFCPTCGQKIYEEIKIDTRNCPKCGERVQAECKFCTNCGTALDEIQE